MAKIINIDCIIYNPDQEKRITDMQRYAGDPVISEDRKTVYFIVNEVFVTNKNERYLYKANINRVNLTEIK